jgi:hypothetical protein
MYCPTCKQKYPNNVSECPADKTKLVQELPFQAVPADDGTVWVEIATVGTLEEAELLKGFLESEGIPAEVENVEPRIVPANFGALGDIRIYVADEDEQKALALLKKRENEYDDLDDDTETVVTDEGEADIDENEPVEAEKE